VVHGGRQGEEFQEEAGGLRLDVKICVSSCEYCRSRRVRPSTQQVIRIRCILESRRQLYGGWLSNHSKVPEDCPFRVEQLVSQGEPRRVVW